MQDKYIFPAIFSKEDDGYNISFPDLPGAFTCGDNFNESMNMAKECLELYINDMDEIPVPQDIESFNLAKGEFIVLIEADLIAFRKKYGDQLIKKTLTIPRWLDETAKIRKINFSKVLKEALEKEITR